MGSSPDAHISTSSGPAALRASAKQLSARLREDHVVLASAGVAFFGFLALIPAMAAVISVYGLVADPEEAAEQIQELFSSLPSEASDLLSTQVDSLVDSSSGSLSVTLVVSILASLWAASAGMSHLVDATNLVYRVTDQRGFVARRGTALGLTLGAAVLGTLALLMLTVVLPALADPLPGSLRWLVTLAGWLVLAAVFVVAVAVLYRVGPQREDPAFAWVTRGGLFAVVLFAVATAAFQFYVSNFGSYNETYGSLAAVAVLLLWLFIAAFVVLLAGEVNVVVEKRFSEAGGDPD
ncbi:MAG: YihY/virulence factor BrkB family protein [Microthrixaceae bacterium]|nr:YihY/virulence factor BrkB family protein [Microthrixaceae bacterium]